MPAVLSSAIPNAADIPKLTPAEAGNLANEALARFIHLLETLTGDEWSRPTPCTAWDVHDVVAHQAGGYASGVSYGEMLRQYTRIPKKGQLPEDAVNELQVNERKSMTPAELIAELKQVGPPAIHNWTHGFRAIKWIAIPHPVAGMLSMRYLMHVVHSRDTWMHRLDICRAANRPFEQTREHDGRIVELVVLDVAKMLNKRLNGRAILLRLTGISGGAWRIGNGDPVAEMEMDVLDFNIFVSGRYSYEEGISHTRISGDRTLIEKAFKDFLVLY